MKRLFMLVIFISSITSMLQASNTSSWGYNVTDTARPYQGRYDYLETHTARRQQDRMRYTREHEKRAYDYRLTGSELKHAQEYDKKIDEENKALTKAIAAKFSMDEIDAFTTETFKELAEMAAKSGRPFFIAVVRAPGTGNFHFFNAAELAHLFSRGQMKNPLTRKPIEDIYIYQYDKNSRSTFPFKYIEAFHDVRSGDHIRHFIESYEMLRSSL